MIKVYLYNDSWFEVSGANEKEAAKQLKKRLNDLKQQWNYYSTKEYFNWVDIELEEVRREIREKYGVTIK